MRVVLTGGGTGGHIYPAVSVGQALRELEPSVELLFVGSSHGPEGDIVRQQGIPFQAVPSSPLTKSLSLQNMKSFLRLFAGVFRARRILREFGADVVIGTGGYTTAAVLIAQRRLGGKVVIHEQNTVPGRTNMWLSRIADKVCVTFEDSAKCFPREKVAYTGMPIRKGFAELQNKDAARCLFGLEPGKFTVLVVGGSQGAKKLNELMADAWPMIDDGNTQVLHQVGKRNLEEMNAHRAACATGYHIHPYLDMLAALASADLVVSRSGASTIAEITAAGRPSILVPYPYAYANHQMLNAQCVERAGAAIVRDEADLNSQDLANLITELRSSPDKMQKIASASLAFGKPDAAAAVAREALSLIKG